MLSERVVFLVLGPLVGVLVGAGAMTLMHRTDHGSQMEAKLACTDWMKEANGSTRFCIPDEATRQHLGLSVPKADLSEDEAIQHPLLTVKNRFRY